MAIPSTIESLSTTAASNGPAGSEQRTLADDGLRAAYAFIRQLVTMGSNIASASSITPPSTGSSFHITGVTTITAIASTNSWDGRTITLIFDGILQLTHSSNFDLPGSANITTAANDTATFIQTGSGAWRLINYRTAAGGVGPFLPLAGGAVTGNVTLTGTSGAALTVNGVAGSDLTASFSNTGATAPYIAVSGPSSVVGYLGTTGTVVTVGSNSSHAVSIRANNAESIGIATTKNVTVAAASSGTTLDVTGVTGQSSIKGGGAFAGGLTYIYSLNSDNTDAASHAAVIVGVGGASAGDAYIRFDTPQIWYAGSDNSDSDKFKIGTGTAVGTSAIVVLDAGGVSFTGTGVAGSDAFVYNGGTSGSFRVNTTGVPYATSAHNNAGAVTGTTNQYYCSGTYTPTVADVSNTSARSGRLSTWARVGNAVIIGLNITIDPTAADTSTEVTVTMPPTQSGNFSAVTEVTGLLNWSGASGTDAEMPSSAGVFASVGAQTARITFQTGTSVASRDWSGTIVVLVV